MKRYLIFLMCALPAFAQEAEQATEHGEIPWGNIGVQALNLFLLLGILTYFLRHQVRSYFATRAAEYRELVDRAENARKEAEQSRNQIQARMQKLEANAQDGIDQARSEADQLRARMLQEAKTLSTKMEQDAQRTAAVELEKAKLELRHELLEQGLASSLEILKKSLGSTEQKKLQHEFAQKIELVGG